MNRILSYFLSLALVVLATGCISDDSDLETLIEQSEKAIAPIDIALDYSPLDEPADEPATDIDDPYYNDYVENDTYDRVVHITFNGESATIDGAENYSKVDVTTNGAHVTINSSSGRMEYVLSGWSLNGSLKIYSENKFKLTLDGVNLTNPNGAAINDQCGKTVYVVLNAGTNNTLTDGAVYKIPAGEQMKGAFFSEGQIIVSGTGLLNVNAQGGHGIASDDYIRFRPGCRLNIASSGGHGVKANDGVFIDGGVLNISVTGDGFKGIKSDLDISVAGGRTTVITTGDSKLVEQTLETMADTSSCAGIKCDGLMTVTGGAINLKSIGEGGKGINATEELVITGGTVNVVTTGKKIYSSPKGIKSDGNISISGGTIYSYSRWGDAIEAEGTLTIAPTYKSSESNDYYMKIVY